MSGERFFGLGRKGTAGDISTIETVARDATVRETWVPQRAERESTGARRVSAVDGAKAKTMMNKD